MDVIDDLKAEQIEILNAGNPPTSRHATQRHATPRHATPHHAAPRHAMPRMLVDGGG